MRASAFLPLLLLLSLVLLRCGPKQTTPPGQLPADLSRQVDDILKPWNEPGSPGAAVAILKDGEVVFTKGYGLANLEYNVPITPSSVFHVASESKQFVAFCIVLLAQEGKLSLDDDIRKHLPLVPRFDHPITIRHLIHHTSGLRDQWQLMAISGTRLDDVITQEHILKLVAGQKALNFTPGERHLYCNTGYTLLAEIVRQAGGQSLRQFAEARIFKPLGMKNTHFHDDYTEVVKGRTYSYNPAPDDKFTNSVLSYSTVGATSLFTTVEDEARWLRNYETGQVGGPKALAQMQEFGLLNGGKKLEYAFALNIDSYKGHQRIGHGGADAGFRSYAVRFPGEKLGIVVFSNVGSFDAPGTATKIADLFLTAREEAPAAPAAARKPGASVLAQYAGSYTNPEGNPLRVVVEDGKLQMDGGFGRTPLEAVSDSSFTAWGGHLKIAFEPPSGKGAPSPALTLTTNEPARYTRYQPVKLTARELAAYTGTFESDELNERYQVVLAGDSLLLRHRKYADVPLQAVTREQFSCPHWWMGNLLFVRGGNGEVTGLEINHGRVLHLRFNKTGQPLPALRAATPVRALSASR